MAAVKWIFVVLFGVGSAGSLAMAFVGQEPARQPSPRTATPLSLRPFPALVAMTGVPKAPDVATAPEAVPDEKAPEPVAAATPPEPVAEKPAPPVAPKPEPVPVAKAPPAPAPVARPPEPKPEPAPKPEPVARAPEPKPEPQPEPKPEPAAPEPKAEPAPKAEPVAAAPKPEGLLNLRASDTADVYLDGKKLGGSPLLGIKAKAGNHKVRFDCYDAAGNTVAGPVQTIAVKADSEVDVEYPCPVE